MNIDSLQPSGSILFDLLRFTLFLVLAILPLGYLSLKAVRVHLGSVWERLALSLLTGTLLVNTLYFALRWFQHENWVFPVLGSIAILGIITIGKDLFSDRGLPKEVLSRMLWLAAGLFIAGVAFQTLQNLGAVIWTPEGGLIFTKGTYSDALWKLSVLSELEHSLPPQIPILAGHRLTYHYFIELFAVFAHLITPIDVLSLHLFWIPLLCFTLLGSLVFMMARRVFGDRTLGAIATFFTLTSVIASNLRYNSHIALGIALFLAVILLIGASVEGRRKSIAVLAILLMGHAMMFESVLSLWLIPSLGFGALLLSIQKRRFEPLAIVILGSLLAVSLQVWANGKLGGRAGDQVFVLSFPVFQEAVMSFQPYRDAIKTLALFYRDHSFYTFEPRMALELVSVPFLWVFAVAKTLFSHLGLGLLGIPFLVQRLRTFKNERPETFLFWVIAGIGILLPFFIGVSYWRGISLRIFSFAGLLLHIAALGTLLSLWQRSWPQKAVALALVGLLWLYPTLNRVLNVNHYYSYLSPPTMEVLRYLRQRTPTDSILAHPFIDDPVRDSSKGGEISWTYKDHYLYGSAIGGRRVVMEGPIHGVVTAIKPLKDLQQIREEILRIYGTEDPAEALALLEKHRVSYLWVANTSPLHFESSRLTPVVQNNDFTLFQVTEKAAN